MISYKRLIEEVLELAGYFVLLLGSLESYWQLSQQKRLRGSGKQIPNF